MNRDRFNKQTVLNYVKQKYIDAKQLRMFRFLRQEVEIGANGTQKYLVKHGKNKGKIL